MNCQDAHQLIGPFVDRELDLLRNLELERHLESCPGCSALRKGIEQLGDSVRTHAPYFSAPGGLEETIRTQLHLASGPEIKKTSQKRSFSWALFVAASVTGLALLTAIGVGVLRHSSADETLAQQVVASHIRSLMANHLTDIPSSDQHTVKPWFNGKLDFSPPVKDFKTQGFPLTGGRLDYLDGRPVAALLYARRRHTINLFVWPSPNPDSPPQTLTIKGYNVVHWTQSAMTYWAVSDLNGPELNEFALDQQK